MKEIFNSGIGIKIPSSLEESLILGWSEIVKLQLHGTVTMFNDISQGKSRVKTSEIKVLNLKF